MTDKELLELAAKAAELDYIKNCVWIENGFYSPLNKHERIPWNPLTDDGDALRLAVKLGIDIRFGFAATQIHCDIYDWAEEAVKVDVHEDGRDDPYAARRRAIVRKLDVHEDGRDDPYAATRRAIVRAAAEIGRMMG